MTTDMAARITLIGAVSAFVLAWSLDLDPGHVVSRLACLLLIVAGVLSWPRHTAGRGRCEQSGCCEIPIIGSGCTRCLHCGREP